MMLRPFFVLAITLALAACGSGKTPVAAEGANAQGEILGGTISDSMLPLDELKSESPPMKVAPSEGAGVDDSSANDDAASEDTTDAEPDEPAQSGDPAEPAEEG